MRDLIDQWRALLSAQPINWAEAVAAIIALPVFAIALGVILP